MENRLTLRRFETRGLKTRRRKRTWSCCVTVDWKKKKGDRVSRARFFLSSFFFLFFHSRDTCMNIYIYIYILVVEVSLAVLSVTNDRNDRQGLSRVLASADASRILCLLLCSRVGKVITSARQL